jgi:uncharacterized protein involved in exopolysaccharide biosynthesis
MDVKVPETRSYADERDQPLVRGGVIDMHLLSQVVRSEAVLVATIIAVFMVLAIAYLHVAAQKYAVRMVITGIQSSHSETSGALDDISSLAGIDLPSSGNSQFKMFVGALRSPFAAQSIAADPDLLKAMFPREWSASEGRWREPPSHVMPVIHAVGRFFGWHIPPWSAPGVARVFDYLKDELKVVPDSKSGVVTMELDSRYPDAAARILLALNNAVDERIRQRDLKRSTTDIGYLSDRLASVTVEEYRKALVTNLVDQEKMRMLASAPLPYVSDALGTPLISAKPVSPIPAAVLAAALVLGGLLALGVATLKYRRR